MASGSGHNSSNNPNKPLPVALTNGAHPRILNPSQYASLKQRIDDARAKLDMMQAQNDTALENYNLVQQLERTAELGRRAQQVMDAVRGGAITSKEFMDPSEYSRKAAQFISTGPGDRNTGMSSASTGARLLPPANPMTAYPPAQVTQAHIPPAVMNTPVNMYQHTQVPTYPVQHFPASSMPSQIRTGVSNQQSYVQSSYGQHIGAVDPTHAQMAEHLAPAYAQKYGIQPQMLGNTSTGQFSYISMAQAHPQQNGSLPRQPVNANISQSVGHQKLQQQMDNAVYALSSSRPQVTDPVMSQFILPSSPAVVPTDGNTSSNNINGFYSNSSSSLAGALDDSMYPHVSPAPHGNNQQGENAARATTQVGLPNYTSVPQPSRDANLLNTVQKSFSKTLAPANTQDLSIQNAPVKHTSSTRAIPKFNGQGSNAQRPPVQSTSTAAQKASVSDEDKNLHKFLQIATIMSRQGERKSSSSGTASSASLKFAQMLADLMGSGNAQSSSPVQRTNPAVATPSPAPMRPIPAPPPRQDAAQSFRYYDPTPFSGPSIFSSRPQDQINSAQINSVYRKNIFRPSTSQTGTGLANVSGATQERIVTEPAVHSYTPYAHQLLPTSQAAQMTPANADRRRLARDILRALGAPPKRKASRSLTSDEELKPSPKRQALEVPIKTSLDSTLGEIDSTEEQALEPPPETSLDPILDEVDRTDGQALEPPPETPLDPTLGEVDRTEGRALELPTQAPNDLTLGGMDSAEEVENSVTPNEASTSALPDSAMMVVEETPSELPTFDTLAAHGAPPNLSMEVGASSTEVTDLDTALRPFEESSNPLFLPSPEPSPDSPSQSSASSSNLEYVKGPTPGLQVIVEVAPLSASSRRQFMRRSTQEAKVPQVESSLSDSLERFRITATGDVSVEQMRRVTEAENIAASRLRWRPCSWQDCTHVSNSANALLVHVRDHAESVPTEQNKFPCQWRDCKRRFIDSDAFSKHLRNHVRKSILCAYQGCVSEFTHPLVLYAHNQDAHMRNGVETGRLRDPAGLHPHWHTHWTRMPPLKKTFSYHDVHLPVQMQCISKERRARVGPWVAKNMFGDVNFGAPQLKTPRQANKGGRRPENNKQKVILAVAGDGDDKYDFLELPGTTYPASCEDLESLKPIEAIEGGLLLAPDIEGPQGPLEVQYLTTLADRVNVSDTQKYAVQTERESERPEYSEIKTEAPDIGLVTSTVPDTTEELSVLQPHEDLAGLLESNPQPDASLVEALLLHESQA